MLAERSQEVIPQKELGEAPRISGSIVLPTGGLWTNEMLEEWQIRPRPDSNPLTAERIFQTTGIEIRYQARPFETPHYLADRAFLSILQQQGHLVDAILVSNSNPQGLNISEMLRKKYATGRNFNLDVHAACSGFAEELAILGQNHDYFMGKNVSLVAAENYQDTLRPIKDVETIEDPSLAATIFSAGAAGIGFVYGRDLTVIHSKAVKLGEEESQVLKMAVDPAKMVGRHHEVSVPRSESGYFEQDGPKVYEAVRKHIPNLIADSIAESGVDANDIKLVIPHQPSIKVLDALVAQTNKIMAEGRESPLEFYYDIKEGNFSSASAPKALIKAMNSGLIVRGDKIVVCQFGAGFYGRSVVVEIG